MSDVNPHGSVQRGQIIEMGFSRIRNVLVINYAQIACRIHVHLSKLSHYRGKFLLLTFPT